MRIVTRSQWGATAPRGKAMKLPSEGVWLHHSVTARTRDSHADMRTIEKIGVERFGIFSYSWAYHAGTREFLEGAGNTVGAHTARRNSKTHGIVLIGNFENEQLTDDAVADLAEFIRHGGDQKWWKPVLLGGHRDTGAATACPGRHAHARIADIKAAIVAPVAPRDDMVLLVQQIGQPEIWHVADARTLVHVPHGSVAEVLTGDPDWRRTVRELPATHSFFTDARVTKVGPG